MHHIRCVIPAAGKGTRVRPITNNLPKALVLVAGKPTIFHIIDRATSFGIVNFVIIVGYLKDLLIEEIRKEYSHYNIEFVEQKEQLGLGHAVLQSQSFFSEGESMFLVYGDTLFSVNLKLILSEKVYSYLGVSKVEEAHRFGIVEIDPITNNIIGLEEKPEFPKSNLAISGVNFILNPKVLFQSIHYIIDNNIRTKNEYQITDAFSHMIHTEKELFKVYTLDSWFDVGTLPALLKTNQILLDEEKGKKKISLSVDIQDSEVGSYVSIGKRVKMINSSVKNCIIDNDSVLENVILENSVIGRNVCLKNFHGECVLGDDSIINSIL